jgi:hypothetical protein
MGGVMSDKLWLKAEPQPRDIVRTLRTQAQLFRQMKNPAQGDILDRAAEEMEGLRDELAALKAAAGPVVEYFRWLKITEEDEFEPNELIIGSSLCGVTLDQLIELERLCGEG